ncbi:MAG: hypothetical protein HYX92_17265 [Chloroflexi bacterium]|nr:hypothetical protein [Chloroflexota bacterium]
MTTLKVGIPRALIYYHYYPMWRTFFERLGAEVVTSPATTGRVVRAGSSCVVSQTCLSMKVYCGHVMSLVGQCDCIFVPAIRSVERNVYNCSNFLGLPDLVKAVVPDCPLILDVDIDVNRNKRALYESIYRLGRRFTWNPFAIKDAAEAAWRAHQDYQMLMSGESLSIPQAIDRLFGDGGADTDARQGTEDLTVAVIGHPYMIHDDYASQRLVFRLRGLGARVVTAEMVPAADLDEGVRKLAGRPYWTYEDELVGAAGHYLHSEVDGIVGIVPFGCGPDSVMVDVVQRYVKRNRTKPIMILTIDEHTGEAGLVTRLEAYLDMVRRRRRGCA